MREPAPGGHDAIGEAARRLDRALSRLEKLVGEGRSPAEPDPNPDLFGHSAALSAELDAARARERALQEAAAAASEALGRAADEVRLALGEDDTDTDETAGAEPEGGMGGGQGDPPRAEPGAPHPDKEPVS
jgi:hypothetical protein